MSKTLELLNLITEMPKKEREYEFISLSAKEPYDRFCKKRSHLLERITKNDIAAYLGITKSSLSRLLREK